MTKTEADSGHLVGLPSIADVKPIEEGGPIARSGFNYQDEIAVGFLIEMLDDSLLLEVHCETHDDVVLVRSGTETPERQAEYIQVKAHEMDSLWSIPKLCEREKNRSGSSIFETSLGRDKYCEVSRFRIVTLRPVVNDLELLTFPFGTPGRETGGARFLYLKSEIERRCQNCLSQKGNGADFWIENCYWDVRHSEEAIRDANLLRIIKLSCNEGQPLLPEFAELLMDELRAWAKEAGGARWEPNRDLKIITREALHTWWEKRRSELLDGIASLSGGKLRGKMVQAGLSDDLIMLALELRRDYASDSRTSRYMEPGDVERIQKQVKSEVLSLRARFVAGQLNLDGPGFHSFCLERMEALNGTRPAGCEDRASFLKGCMYDIADRCLLRFDRPAR